MNTPIISVTGTKGKTTTVAIIADALQKFGHNTLKVDTTGHFVNGERRSTLEDSKETWQLVPSVAPGRYLWEFHANPELAQNGVAVLECSLGSSRLAGLGYGGHDVGVFLNVFEDHIGTSDRLNSKEDIARAKEFIFARVKSEDGWLVFNADDRLVVDRLEVIPDYYENTHLLPIGFDFSAFDVDKHLAEGGEAMTARDGKIILLTQDGEKALLDYGNIPWTFNGNFLPSLWNLMAAVAAVYASYGGKLPANAKEIFESVRLDRYSGRLTVLQAKNGAQIIADYAHEKESLANIGELGRALASERGGRLIGVVRLAHDRPDEVIESTGEVIGKAFDQVVVYDKIDGFWRKPKKAKVFPQVVGRTSEVLISGVKKANEDAERIIREDEALGRAAEIAGPNDVVVTIVNDDIKRSLDFIQKSFEAEFV